MYQLKFEGMSVCCDIERQIALGENNEMFYR